MTVADASTRSLAFLTNPNVDDASWQLVEAPAPAWIDASAPPPPSFGVASLSRAPGLAGLLLTKSPTVTGPCVGVSGFSPPSAGDAVLAPAATAGSQAAWTFFVPPVPPPPPGIGVTDVHDNRYFLPTADVYECGLPLAEYQASCASCDPGSTAAAWPADDVILTAARAALGL